MAALRLMKFRFAAALAGALLGLAATPATAQINFQVTFSDPTGTHAAYYAPVTSNLLAAANDWGRCLNSPTPSILTIQISFTDIPTEEAASASSEYVRTLRDSQGHYSVVYEQSAATKIRTGQVKDYAGPDAFLNVGDFSLTNQLWFDPHPDQRTDTVPSDKVDAISVFEHELGHVFAFNGYRNDQTGALPGSYLSTFDQDVVAQNGSLYFTGPQAMSVYGGPVPLTDGNYRHLGNSGSGPGADLVSDLMNGVQFDTGERYHISPLDLAMLSDSGVGVRPNLIGPSAAVPEPSSLLLLVPAIPVLVLMARRRKAGRSGEVDFPVSVTATRTG